MDGQSSNISNATQDPTLLERANAAWSRWKKTAAENLQRGLISASESLKHLGIEVGDPRSVPAEKLVDGLGTILGLAGAAYVVINMDRITLTAKRAVENGWKRARDVFRWK